MEKYRNKDSIGTEEDMKIIKAFSDEVEVKTQ